MSFKTIFIIITTVLLTIIVMQNNAPVQLKFLFWEVESNKLALILGCTGLGLITGLLLRGSGKAESKTEEPENEDRSYLDLDN